MKKEWTVNSGQWTVRKITGVARAFVLATLIGMSALIGCGSDSRMAANIPASPQTAATPSDLANQADAILRTDMTDHQQRTQALFLYRRVLDQTSESNPQDLPLRARANLGIGLVNFYDIFDILPTLLNMLGLNLSDIIGGISSLQQAAAPAGYHGRQNGRSKALASSGVNSSLLSCGSVVNFGSYMTTLNSIISNMIIPATDHFGQALADDPNVSIVIESGLIMLSQDKPLTPQDEALALDLTGTWDAGEIGAMNGVLQILLGALKIMSAYDGLLQTLINPAFNPDCSPAPGSPEWVAVFGPYGVLDADGGLDRMTEAGQLLHDGFASMGAAFAFIAAETGDQNNHIIRYWDVGKDGIGPGDPSYTGPDADGTEGNGLYDPGEPWGSASLGDVLNGFVGGLLPVDLGQLSKGITLPILADFMDTLAVSAQTNAPVDLIQSLAKPLLQALGIGSLNDQALYSLGLPALNLGAPFNPPWLDITFLNPLTDASGNTIVEVEATDDPHTWPAPYTRIDPPNGSIDPKYSFYPDLDESGATIGVMGGLLLFPVTDAGDFDGDGNLIGTVDYRPMVNPEFNAIMTTLGGILGSL